MANIIEIKNLIYIYESSQEEVKLEKAINDVSLEVERGSFTAIIGKNGSGKSTLAKCVNGLFLPSGGQVLVDGMDSSDESKIWDIRQTAGMVFQNPDNQIVSSIVEDDVAFGPENLGIEPELIREKVNKALETVRMGEYRKKGPHMLSGGQKQRIAIAGAVAMEPDCIIFDEPTAMLDPQGREEVMKIIHELNEKGITVVLITHMMEEAALADKIIIMDAGEKILEGTPKEVFGEEKTLKNLSLDVPFPVEVACRLRDRGISISKEVLSVDDLVSELKGLKGRK